mmetsp:Transcript_145536/g.362888  ORF Transcript_145536/g.362888 Transcript_145536/m.362888 type:complete len:764 (-) Transcript_145536:169-2460(-)
MAMDHVHEMTPMAMDGSDPDDDDASVHSAISNPSEFEDDEEVEYLAMDLVNHLPPEKASKLLKNMRTKEKAVQDLLHRNRSLLENCQHLDDENQALTDRLQEAEAQAAAAPPPQPAAPPASVDTSFFQKMERGKEEKILRLQKERDQLMMQVRRLDEGGQRLEESLVQARKEIKKLQSQQGRQPVQQVQAPQARVERADSAVAKGSLMDEEERIYQELQGKTKGDSAFVQQQRCQEENKKRIHAALQALLKEDVARMERWGSDIAALLLAVDGLEAEVRPGGKDKTATKKGKAVQTSSAAPSERLQELSALVLDDFDALRNQLENTEKLQLSLEQTARGVHDGADAAVVAMDLDASLAGAEREASLWQAACSQEHAQRAEGLSLGPITENLGRTEATLETLLTDAPPGLIPPHAQASLSEARGQIAELRRYLNEHTQRLAELQDGSTSRAQSLQAALQAHKQQLSRKAAEELQRSAAAFEQPLQRMRGGLRQQSEAVTRSRGRVSSALEELAAVARRSAADGTSSGAEPSQASGAGNEALLGGIREVRSMGRSLISGLEEGGKALEGKFLKVYASIVGEEAPPSSGGGAKSSRAGPTAAAAAGSESAAEAKKKKGKKKGKGEPDGTQATQQQPQAGGNASPADQEAKAGGGAGRRRPEDAEDLQLRKEFASFADQDVAKSKSTDKSSGRSVLKGAELLQELQSLRSDEDKLKARIAERRKALKEKQDDGGDQEPDADGAGDEQAEEPVPARPAPKARRKKMFV